MGKKKKAGIERKRKEKVRGKMRMMLDPKIDVWNTESGMEAWTTLFQF